MMVESQLCRSRGLIAKLDKHTCCSQQTGVLKPRVIGRIRYRAANAVVLELYVAKFIVLFLILLCPPRHATWLHVPHRHRSGQQLCVHVGLQAGRHRHCGGGRRRLGSCMGGIPSVRWRQAVVLAANLVGG